MPKSTWAAALLVSYALTMAPAHAQAANPTPPGPSSPAPAPASQEQPLHWQHGPVQLALSGIATLNLPFGYGVLSPPDSKNFLRMAGNPVSDGGPATYILAAHGGTWFAAIYYEDAGHVADDQKIDADALFKSVQDGQQEENQLRQQQNMPTMTLDGWGAQPSYDPQTHRLQWAFQFSDSGGQKTENFNTRLLSRTGYMHIILVDDPARIAADIPQFNTAIAGLEFNEGQRYADYKSGDRLAAYGIAGLIAGGAAAAAAKTGLLAGLIGILAAGGKAIFGVVLAGIAFGRRYIARLFKRQ